MPLWTILLYGGAAASTYFLVTMLSALIHGDPEVRARLQAAGLAASLILLMIGALLRPFPAGEPAKGPPLRYPTRVPGLPSEGDFGQAHHDGAIAGVWGQVGQE